MNISSFFTNLPLTRKILLLNILMATLILVTLDFFVSQRLSNIFANHLFAMQKTESQRDRLHFDRIINNHTTLVKLLAESHKLHNYLATQPHQQHLPSFLFSASILQSLIVPDHILLFNGQL